MEAKMAKRKKKKKGKRKRRSVVDSTRKRRENAGKGFGASFLELPEGMEMFSLKSTKTAKVDIIPYEVGKGNPQADKGELYWERTFFVHRGIGPNEDWLICPARTKKKPCPICEFIAKLSKDPDAEEDEIKKLRPSKRMIMNVIDKLEGDDVVRVWESSHAYFGRAMDEALEGAYEDDEDNMDAFCDPEDGYWLKLVVEEGYQKRGYSVERVDFKSRKEDLDEDTLDAVACLDDILIIKSYEELKELLLGGEDDEEDEPKGKKKKKKKKKRDKEEDEEEESEEFDDEDFDEADLGEDEDPEFEEDDQVWCDDDGEDVIYTIASIDDDVITLSDGEEEYDVAADTVHLIEDEDDVNEDDVEEDTEEDPDFDEAFDEEEDEDEPKGKKKKKKSKKKKTSKKKTTKKKTTKKKGKKKRKK